MMEEINKDYKVVIEIKPAELKSIITSYHNLIYKGQLVKVEIKSGEQCIGFYETKYLYTKINLKRKIRINGLEATVEEQIEDDKVKEILNQYLEEHNYEVSKLDFETRRRSIGMYENDEIYFNCLKVGVKQKEKQKQKVL